MVLISRRNNKVVGSILIVFGIFSIFYLLYSKTLTLDQHSFFITRYFKVIFFSYCGLFGISFGVLYVIGFLSPNNVANPYERAKTKVWESIFSFPLFMLMLVAVFGSLDISNIQSYLIASIIFSCLLIVWSVWNGITGFNTLKKFYKKK